MKLRVHGLKHEVAIGSLAQELLPEFLGRTHREWFNGSLITVYNDRASGIQAAFETAEQFLEVRAARLRASEAKLRVAAERRRERRKKKTPKRKTKPRSTR